MTADERVEAADLALKLNKSFNGLSAHVVMKALVSLIIAASQGRKVTKAELLDLIGSEWDHMEQAFKNTTSVKAKA